MSTLPGLYRHLKSGNIYEVERVGIVNATDAQDGQVMVMYWRKGTSSASDIWFVREEREFRSKFVRLQGQDDVPE